MFPAEFQYEVGDPDWKEWWTQGLELILNPNAVQPLSLDIFSGVAHHIRHPNGQIESRMHGFQPFASTTTVFLSKP